MEDQPIAGRLTCMVIVTTQGTASYGPSTFAKALEEAIINRTFISFQAEYEGPDGVRTQYTTTKLGSVVIRSQRRAR